MELYKEFHAQSVHLKDWVPLNDEDEMEECRKEGLLYSVFIEGQKAGLIGGVTEAFLGHSAVYFVEVILSSQFRGRGFAPAVQRAFIDLLPETNGLVWGTIDAKNSPSLQSALRVGRVVVRREFLLSL